MPTEEALSHAVGCLSSVFPAFLAKEIARITDEIVSATQAITDPLAAIADTNVQGLVDDVATLAEGNNFESLAAIATGLGGSYVKRELQERMVEAALQNPDAIKKILQAQNKAEEVVGGAMFLFGVFREAPYAMAQKMCEQIIRIGDLKINQLQCLKKHIIQMNNVVSALAKAKNEIVDWTAELQRLSEDLDEAKKDLSVSSYVSSTGKIGFNENALARAVTALKEADAILDPKSSDLNLLSLTNILTTGSTSSEHITEANIKLAHMALPHLNFLLEAEATGIRKSTEAINFSLNGLVQVLDNFRSSAVSQRAAEIRQRTILALRDRVSSLKLRVDSAIKNSSTRKQTAQSLLWSSTIKSIVATADKVQSSSFEAGSSKGVDDAAYLKAAYDALIGTINQIDSENVTNAVDDVFSLTVLVTSIRKSGERLLDILDERALSDGDLLNFSILVAEAATGGNNRIEESITATRDLQNVCRNFVHVDIGFREDYDRLLKLLDTVGLDRARDLLDSGRIAEFFDSSVDYLSYLNTAISCLTESIKGVDDVGTKNEIAGLRDELQSQRSNQLLTSVDNLNFGATRVLDTARASLERFQQRQEAAKGLVEKLKALGEKLKFDVGSLGSGFETMKGNLGQLDIDANGRLSADLDEFMKRPRAGVPLC